MRGSWWQQHDCRLLTHHYTHSNNRIEWYEFLSPLSIFLHEHINLGGGRAVDVDLTKIEAIKRECHAGQVSRGEWGQSSSHPHPLTRHLSVERGR